LKFLFVVGLSGRSTFIGHPVLFLYLVIVLILALNSQLMIYTKRNLTVCLLFLLTLILNYACNSSTNSSDGSLQTNTASDITELKVGGLYIIKKKDSTYSVSKILAIDDFAVHLRMYSNKFQSKPTQLNSVDLDVLIGHAPLDKQGFLIDKPELLKVEEVKDSELEGYKIYLEEMRKGN